MNHNGLSLQPHPGFVRGLLRSLASLCISRFQNKCRTAPIRNVGNTVVDGTTATEDVSQQHLLLTHLDDRKPAPSSNRVSVSTVGWFTLAMAAATGLGALPFFFVELDPQWAGLCNGMAAGVMLAASFDLIQEGQDHGSGTWVVIGILSGGIFIWLCKKVITSSLFYSTNTNMLFTHQHNSTASGTIWGGEHVGHKRR